MDIDKAASDLAEIKFSEDSGADRKILIAVEFGTTFSGVVWAQTRRIHQFTFQSNPVILT